MAKITIAVTNTFTSCVIATEDQGHVPVLYKGLYELLAQAGQAVAVLPWKAQPLALGRQLLTVHGQEAKVGRESTEQVQDVVAPIITDDALALDGRAELYGHLLLVKHGVPLHLKRPAGLL